MTGAELGTVSRGGNGAAAGRPYVVTGGAGFIGSNLADALLQRGERVILLDSLARAGVRANARWLADRHGDAVELVEGDVRDRALVRDVVAGAQGIVHLAAQVAVTSSLQDPMADFSVNVEGTLSVLEALRAQNAKAPLVFASTNKVYGRLEGLVLEDREDGVRPAIAGLRGSGLDESWPLDFCTPYGCSKGAADQYVLDYARSYGVPAVAVRMSCVYGPRQLGTEDQGWLAHFAISAIRQEPVTIYGSGRQVRDVVHVADAVRAYLYLIEAARRLAGTPFNLGGGPANAVSLLTAIAEIEALTTRPLRLRFEPIRKGDQPYYVANSERLKAATGWSPAIEWREGLRDLVGWISQNPKLLGTGTGVERQEMWSLSA